MPLFIYILKPIILPLKLHLNPDNAFVFSFCDCLSFVLIINIILTYKCVCVVEKKNNKINIHNMEKEDALKSSIYSMALFNKINNIRF